MADGGYSWGLPVVEGASNFLATPPSPCESAPEAWTFRIGSDGALAPPGTGPDAFFKPEARLTFTNVTGDQTVMVSFPNGVVPDVLGGWLQDIELWPGASMSMSLLRYTAVMLNFTITCRLQPSGVTTRLRCHICPTPII